MYGLNGLVSWLPLMEQEGANGGAPSRAPNSPEPPDGHYENEQNLSEKDVADLLNFDPFPDPSSAAESRNVPTPGGESSDGEGGMTDAEVLAAMRGEQAPTQPAAPEPETPQVSQQAPVPQGEVGQTGGPNAPSETELLKQELQQMRMAYGQMQQTLASMQQPAQQRPAQGGEQPAGADPSVDLEMPAYDFNVPPDLVNAIVSDEPGERQVAIQALLKGFGQAIHQTVMNQVVQQYSQVPRVVQSALEAQRQRQEVFDDFYGTYPQFNQPHLRQIVLREAQQMSQEGYGNTWNQRFRDDLASRLMAQMQEMATGLGFAANGGAPVGQPAQPAQPQLPVQNGTPRPPHVFGTGASTSAPTTMSGLELDILGTMNAGRG